MPDQLVERPDQLAQAEAEGGEDEHRGAQRRNEDGATPRRRGQATENGTSSSGPANCATSSTGGTRAGPAGLASTHAARNPLMPTRAIQGHCLHAHCHAPGRAAAGFLPAGKPGPAEELSCTRLLSGTTHLSSVTISGCLPAGWRPAGADGRASHAVCHQPWDQV